MARYSYGSKGGRVRRRTASTPGQPTKTGDEIVRELKKAQQRPEGEDYRERSLAIHGLICARCGREFDHNNRHLLTVHHKDGDHHNNPPDGSNWENLCVYCHDDAHSRSVLGEYIGGSAGAEERTLVFQDDGGAGSDSSTLGDLLRKALEEKGKKGS